MICFPAEILEKLSDPLLCFDRTGELVNASPAGRNLWASRQNELQALVSRVLSCGTGASGTGDAFQFFQQKSSNGDYLWLLARPDFPNQENYRALAENCPLSVIRYDRELKISYLNQQLVDYLKVGGREQVIGKRPYEIWPGGEFSEIERAAEKAVREGQMSAVEWAEHQDIGPPRHHQVLVMPERGSSGEILGALAFGGELTALRLAEKTAWTNELALRAIVDNIPLCISRYDENCRVLFVNPQFTQVWGLRAEELLGKHLDSFPHGEPSCKERSQREIREVFHSGLTRCEQARWSTPGGERTYEILFIPEKDENGRVASVLALAQDITARLKAEEELRLLNQAVDCSLDNLFLLTEDGVFDYVNETALRTLGYERSELIGQKFTVVDPSFPMDKFLEMAQSDETLRLETVHRTKGGESFPVELSTSALVFQGRRYRLGIARNIKDRKLLEEQLRQACKMEAVGQLAGGIAHDFNNILTAINLQVEVLKLEEGLTASTRSGLDDVLENSNRAKQLVRQLLTFSRRQLTQPNRLDFNEVIEGASKMLRRLVRESVEFSVELACRPLPMVADAAMLEQILLNLTVNASDAMPQGGKLCIQTRAVHLIGEIEELAEGPHALLVVQDTGMGMDAETLPRIFEPFFSTKELGRGTGLGLSSVFGIVKQHFGAIRVLSSLGQGSTFEIYLPLLSEQLEKVIETPASYTYPKLNGSVLVVEDDAQVRNMVCQLLQRAGLTVVGAEDAGQACAHWKDRDNGFDLLLTDLVLPGGTDGRQLAQKLISQRTDLKVIFASGYNQELAGLEINQLDDWPFLPKPFVHRNLMESIGKALGDGGR